MANTQPRIVLSKSQDIPFNKLVLSQSNVRRVQTGISIEELAEDIARRGLLQSLNVRPVRDAAGAETGVYEVPAGGRRFRALELLVKQKRMTKAQPVPCIVRDEGIAEEDSLAENVQRVALHPLDQFRAFQTLREAGLGEEDIAARFFVTATVVKQRLRLAAVSPKLLDLYEADQLTLETLMAFTVTADQARQEQAWEAAVRSRNTGAYYIRRLLTESAVGTWDRRAQFVGVEAYEAAGGVVLRDLFSNDNGAWLQDPALLDRIAIEKLTAAAEALRAEGWKWIEAALQFPYGHTARLHRIKNQTPPLTDEEQSRKVALGDKLDRIQEEYADADELPEQIVRLIEEIEAELDALENRPEIFDPADVARAGIFVSIDENGALRVERGFVRPEDMLPPAAPAVGNPFPNDPASGPGTSSSPECLPQARPPQAPQAPTIVTVTGPAEPEAAEEEDGIKPLSDRLIAELTAHRTLALRDALAGDPEIAFVAVLHPLCLRAFYHYAFDSCLEIEGKSAGFANQAPGLADCASAKSIEARHDAWAKRLPEQPGGLWDALLGFDAETRAALFAHCVSLSVNAIHEAWNHNPGRLAHADQLVRTLGLDMAEIWQPTVENYLARVPKARILEAVREAKGEAAAQLIDHLKKPDMAKEAERLLAATGWLPEPLRLELPQAPDAGETGEAESLPEFLDDTAQADAA